PRMRTLSVIRCPLSVVRYPLSMALLFSTDGELCGTENGNGQRPSSQEPDCRPRHWHLRLIDVAPCPALIRFERCDHGVAHLVEVLRGVSVGRAVAAADMTAAQTEPQVHPPRAGLQAIFASLERMRRSGLEAVHVFAGHCTSSNESRLAQYFTPTPRCSAVPPT